MSLYSGFDILLKINNDDKNVIPQKNRQAVNAAFDNFQTAAASTSAAISSPRAPTTFPFPSCNG